jgi:Tfp pilus assembly protein PilV
MRNLLAHHRQAGFTLVETLLAIMMISVVGILGSRSILSTTLSVSTLNNQRKAATLSEMIFQQYNSYVAQNYNGLESYNKTNVEPSVFFGSPNNMGFDGIYVTTVADYSTNHSTATIKLTLSWKEGGKTKSSDFLKTYAQKSELGSGVVQVYVKAPCSGYTDPALIMANCPGLSNFTISAPTPSGANLTGTTDATGSLLLRGVNVGASVSITVTAPTPSVYTVAKGAAGFVQGYYMVDPKNPQNYLLTSDFPMSVQLGQTDQLLITTFLPAGSVTGQVTNISSVSPTPITDNERIDLHSGFVATAAGFTSCSKILPCSTTTQGGKYAFYNVVTSTSVSVVPYGTMGSAPLIQPTDPAFHWGTLAAPGFDNVVIVPTDWSSTTPPTVTRDISLQVLGWFNLTTVSVSNPALVVPNFPINFNDQALNPIYTNNVHSDSPTDANGHISLYNVVYYTGNLGFFQFYGVQQPFGSNAGAMVQQFGASSAAIGAGTSLQLPVYPGYTLRGSITDSNSTNNCAKKLTMWGPNFFNTAQPNVTTDNAGNFTYLGFYPANYWGSIGTVDPTNFIAYINVQNLDFRRSKSTAGRNQRWQRRFKPSQY